MNENAFLAVKSGKKGECNFYSFVVRSKELARLISPPPLRKLFIVIIIFTLRLQQVPRVPFSLSLSFSVYRNYNMTLSPFLWVYNDDILCLSLFHLKCLSLYFSSDISLFAFQVGRSNLNIWMYYITLSLEVLTAHTLYPGIILLIFVHPQYLLNTFGTRHQSKIQKFNGVFQIFQFPGILHWLRRKKCRFT